MKTLAFCSAYAAFAIVFCIGFGASQLPSPTTFTIVAGVLVVGLGIGFTIFFTEDIKGELKQIVLSAVLLAGVAVGLIMAYAAPPVRALLIGSWSSEIVLGEGMALTNQVGAAACREMLKRDRLTAIRAIVRRPVYAGSSCIKSADESFRASLLTRWDEILFSADGSKSEANAVATLAESYPKLAARILFDCSIRAPNTQTREACAEKTTDFDPKTSYAESAEWWIDRAGLGDRFTASFAKDGDPRLSARIVRRLVLRHVCSQYTQETMSENVEDVFNGWFRHLKCDEKDGTLSQFCENIPTLDLKSNMSSNDETCNVIKASKVVPTEEQIELSAEERAKMAAIGRSITTIDGAVDVDQFINDARTDPNSLSKYSERELAIMMERMQAQERTASEHVTQFSKEAIRKKKIEKVMEEMRGKKGMEKYFNEDGSMNKEAVEAKAKEEGQEL